jgi:hypothetical protein
MIPSSPPTMPSFDVINMTPAELSDWLGKVDAFIPSTVREKFVSENVDGLAFVQLTRDDLNELKVSLGHRKHLFLIIATVVSTMTKKTEQNK